MKAQRAAEILRETDYENRMMFDRKLSDIRRWHSWDTADDLCKAVDGNIAALNKYSSNKLREIMDDWNIAG